VCAVLRTRQDRGSASCPTRPGHASGPWRLRFCTAPAPQRFRHFQRLLVPPGSREKKDQFKDKSKSRNSSFCFCPCSRLGFDASAPAGNCLGRTDGPRRTAGAMDGAYEPTRTYLRRVLRGPSVLPIPASVRRVMPQPRALLGFTRFPKKIALISIRSVPCQYLRCAGSSANRITLPCPCADTSSHALPATRLRLRSDR